MPDAHVLIVEDKKEVADTYALHLREEYTATVAYDGQSALDILDDRGSEIDVALLDRRMPGLSGDEVLEAMQERGIDCAVAMVTAVDPDFDILQLGFDDYMTKPVTKEQLCETVDRLTTHASYDAQVREHLSLVAKKALLEAEKHPGELDETDEYQQLLRDIADSRDQLDAAVSGDVFVELLLRETGDRLYLVVQYDPDSWQYRYVSDDIAETIATIDREFNDLLDQFRREGAQNVTFNSVLEFEGYHCSLHLFEEMVVIHFYQSDQTGIVCGFDPSTATHLTDFVSLVRPYLEQATLDPIETESAKN